ncbi:hypothetical protein RYX36_036911 [Vicia faba]
MREHAREFFQVCLRTEGREPRISEVLDNLNLQNNKDVSMYDQLDAKVVSFYLSLSDTNIEVDDPTEWLVLPVPYENRVLVVIGNDASTLVACFSTSHDCNHLSV